MKSSGMEFFKPNYIDHRVLLTMDYFLPNAILRHVIAGRNPVGVATRIFITRTFLEALHLKRK